MAVTATVRADFRAVRWVKARMWVIPRVLFVRTEYAYGKGQADAFTGSAGRSRGGGTA
ncbi:hypothetical protein GCM10010299_72930 [Streptomyces tanashiensis]|nr:hypothetical protein GCM10010299_72930 [Streptomyces tanashiensis]